MKITFNKYLKKNLIINSAHLSDLSVRRLTSDHSFLYKTKSNIDLINLSYTIYSLKKLLKMIIRITSKKGRVLIISKEKRRPLFIKRKWVNGYLTNSKVMKKKLPHAVVLLNNHINLLEKTITDEANRLAIPLATFITSSSLKHNPTYKIPSNTRAKRLSFMYLNLFFHAHKMGKYKALKAFLPKLESNQ